MPHPAPLPFPRPSSVAPTRARAGVSRLLTLVHALARWNPDELGTAEAVITTLIDAAIPSHRHRGQRAHDARARFAETRHTDASHCRRAGALRCAAWLDAHPARKVV